ncbi:MAG: LamG domain-containing protein [Woeseiaceae bacterium]|nr:LamG domain-containing protein [Woeseiaceae bacterium]
MRNRLNLLALSLFLLLPVLEAHAGQCDAYFAFDGNLQDGSGNGHHGAMIMKRVDQTVTGGEPEFAAGRYGQALRLNGSSAVRAPVDLFPEICGQVTITAWVYVEDGNPNEHTLISNGEGAAVRLSHTRQLLTARGGRSTVRSTGDAVQPNRWTFIAGVWDFESGNITLSWQGRQATASLDRSNLRDPEQSLWIGAFNDSLMWPASGVLIDDLRIIGRAMTMAELRDVMQQSPQVVTAVGDTDPLAEEFRIGPFDQSGDLTNRDDIAAAGDAGALADQTTPLLEPGGSLADQTTPLLEPDGSLADQTTPLMYDTPPLTAGDLQGDGPPAAPGGPRPGASTPINNPTWPDVPPAQPESGGGSTTPGGSIGGSPPAPLSNPSVDRVRDFAPTPTFDGGGSAPTLSLNDTVVRFSEVTGSRGGTEYRVIAQLPASVVATSFGISEVDNVPCRARVGGRNIESFDFESSSADECSGARSISYGAVFGSANPPPASSAQVTTIEAITGVKVCTNDRNGRVKGLIVRRRLLEQDGRLTNANDTVEIERANCGRNEWRSWAECPTGAVAVGMNAYFIPGGALRPDIMQLTGLELRCAMVEVDR